MPFPQAPSFLKMLLNAKDAQAKNFVAPIVPDASKARVEIEEFIGDNEMTNLYLLALEALQKEDANKSVAKRNEDWWTFYSLSGKLNLEILKTLSRVVTYCFRNSWATFRELEWNSATKWRHWRVLHSRSAGISNMASGIHENV